MTRRRVKKLALIAVGFFALMALLSIADLSLAIPATAASYVLETVLARAILKEHVNRVRWAAVRSSVDRGSVFRDSDGDTGLL